jgi:dienelactone hydrolase
MQPTRRLVRSAIAWLAASLCTSGFAKLQEEQIEVPVSIANAHGQRIDQPIQVTVFWDDANPAPAPVLVLNHGRAVDAAERAALGRARYTRASRYFVAQGFIVAVPTRIGYGITGGEDVEASGACRSRRYEPAYAAAAAQVLATLEAVRARPGADRTRSVIVGQSFGGATAIAATAHNPEGVAAAINFAGGGGGDPKGHPERPCTPQAMERLFGQYGSTARLPTLWVYTENDRYFGPAFPREWFKAYQDAGGRGEFVQFPPHGEDGHSLFTRFPEIWQPRVRAFLDQLGFARLPGR